MPNNQFFFCYSVKLFKFLKMDKNIDFICYALHDKTHKPFWLFKRDLILHEALSEFGKMEK